MNWFFPAHSGLRYLVLLFAVLTALYALFGMAMKRRFDATGLTLLRVLAVLIDIQVLLGVGTLVARTYFPALIGHVVMMIAAVAVVHLGAARLKKAPEAERRYGWLLASALIPLALIVAGIMAIQRSVV